MGKLVGLTRVVSGDYNATILDVLLLVDVSNGPCRITLPAGSSGDGFIIKHYKGDVVKNNVTIVGKAGVQIEDGSQISMYQQGQVAWVAWAVDRWAQLMFL